MNSTIKTDSADEKVWECYRSKIESLYWENSLNTIEAHMKERHGFAASKSQYERHFRKWELRKNLTGSEWGIIIRYMKRNSIRLEQVEVLFKGHEIPRKRILQEMARRSSINSTGQDGTHKLPKEVTVRPRSRAPDMDTANGLQTIVAPTASLSSSFMPTEGGFELVTITSPSINCHSLNIPTLVAGYSLPFSWIQFVDLNSFSHSLSASQQLTKWKPPSVTQLDAIFYSNRQSLMDTTHESHDTLLPSCAIVSLVNNVSLISHTAANDAYALLKMLPLNVLSRGLKALPDPILDALKERVFAKAVIAGDVDLVSVMLKLNVDPRERIMMDRSFKSAPAYPLHHAAASGHFALTKTLISHMCQGATQSQLDELVDHVFEGQQWRKDQRFCVLFSESERTELVCIALAAGASPSLECLGHACDPISVASLKQLVGTTTTGIIGWLEKGLLKHYLIGNNANRMERQTLTKDVLQYVLFDHQHYLPRGDPKLKTIMLNALSIVITQKYEEAVKIILKAFSLLGYRLDSEEAYMGDMSTPNYMHDSIAQAFDNADWDLTTSLMVSQNLTAENLRRENLIAQNSMASYKKPLQSASLHEKKLNDAFEKEDLVLAYHLLQHREFLSSFGIDFIELAVSLGQSDMGIKIIQEMESHNTRGIDGLIILLQDGQDAAVSALLAGHPTWNFALQAASKHNNLGPLEAMIFQGSAAPFIREEKEGAVISPEKQQLCFRAVWCHSMTTNNPKVCKWLFQLGMDAEKLSRTREFFTPRDTDDVEYELPSLLTIAAKHNNLGWMKFLLAEGVAAIDSTALLEAVESKAAISTIRFLLESAMAGENPPKRTYGVCATRQAIKVRDFARIDVLCEFVNVDAIEQSTEEFERHTYRLSPLGEAIIANDLEIVQFLLERGANANAYVSFDGLKMLKHIKSHVQRVTPLLAAIDMQSLPIVRILLKYRAEIHYTRNMGILRTPLQRAAEMGRFDIVQYLINEGAIADTLPVYSGGTALQLASLNGFCGIAAFLLKRGADPNYPPAKGDGRTAFEAAAEWGHIDTMSLLMQWNVNLEAQYGDTSESQYERARQFAEKNGFMASKRFVEHLYRQTMGDQSWGDGLALEFT